MHNSKIVTITCSKAVLGGGRCHSKRRGSAAGRRTALRLPQLRLAAQARVVQRGLGLGHHRRRRLRLRGGVGWVGAEGQRVCCRARG